MKKVALFLVSCLFMVQPAWAEGKSGRDVLPSAVGKTLRMPYSSMALTAKLIGPAIEEEDYYNWCVSPIMGKDNKVHIFSSRWPKRLGMEGWIEKEAEIAHFVGDRPEGPFRYVGSVLTSDMLADPATMSAPHNPRLEYVDGKYILLYICQNPSKTGHNTRIGMMIADDINGPWRFAGKNGGIVLDVSTDPANWTSKAVIGIYNPAFLKIKGKYYIYFNCPRKPHAEASYTYGCAVSDKLEGPYVITDAPVTDNVSYIEDAQAFSVGKTHYLLTTDNFGRNSGVYGKMYDLMDTYRGNGTYSLSNLQAARNLYLQDAEFNNTDWFDELFLNSLMHNHSVSFSSGSDKASFYASISAMEDPGWYRQSDVQRYTANLNASYNLMKNLTVSMTTNGSYRNQTAPGTSNRTTDVVSGEVSREFDINPFSYSMNTSRALDPNETYRRNYCDFNIFDELEQNYIDVNVVDTKFQGEINYKPVVGLEIHGLAAIRYQSSRQEHHIMDQSNQARAYRAGIDPEDATIRDANMYLYTDPDDPTALPETVLPNGGIYNLTNYTLLSKDLRGTVAYNTSFDEDKHILNLFGGAELNATDRQSTWFRGWGYQYDMGGTPFYDYNVFKQGAEENTDYYTNSYTYARSLAFFGMATYSYLGRYTLNGTIRYEGTNKLGRSRQARWLPTWNVSAAWNMHEENWFRDTFGDAWTHSMFKLSYSLTADRGPADVTNSRAVYYSYSPYRPLASDRESGMELYQLENSELTYEKKYEFNVGMALGFVDNRINVEADYYTRNNYDLIGYVQTQGVGGEITKLGNVASMASYGFEFSLSTRNIIRKNFSWSTDLIFSYAENKITELDARSQVIDLVQAGGYALEGYPVRALFSIPFAGLNDEGLPTFYTNKERTETTVVDINFQEFNDLDFLQYEGPVEPTITGSLGNTFTYKNWSLNVFLTYSFGNKLRLDPIFSDEYTDLTAMPKEFKNRWMVPGDERYTTIPTIASVRQQQKYGATNLAYAYNAYNYSTERVADGGFIRLKEISLNYNFPQRWFEGQDVVSSCGIKVSATNLCLLYSDKKLNGQDPEYMSVGGVSSPVPRQFTMTLRVGF